jgi:hypothetical protein
VLTAGGSITGVVSGPSGKPLRRFCVTASDRPAQTGSLALTNKYGRYRFTGLATGRYSLYVLACLGGGPNVGEVSRPGLVHVVAPKAVTGVNIELEPGGSISGKVTSASAPTSPQGGVCIELQPKNPNGSFGFGFTAVNGSYRVPDLAPGTYQVYFNDPYCSYLDTGTLSLGPQWYSGQLTQATATEITVLAGHTTKGINAALQPYGGISGAVTVRSHAGVAGECVTAFPFHAAPDEFSGLPQAPEVAISTANGRYALTYLPPGRYKVEFSVGCGDSGFATQWWRGARSAKTATVISVGVTTITGINASLRSR